MGASAKPIEIQSADVVLTEGKEDQGFLDAFLRHCGLAKVQLIRFAEDGFDTRLANLTKVPGWEEVRRLAVVRDADQNRSAKFTSVCHHLRQNNHPEPERVNSWSTPGGFRVGVFIWPDETGMLEDLLLKTVVDHPIMPCVAQYMACLRGVLADKPVDAPRDREQPYFPKHPAKAKAHAFLAGMHEVDYRLGIGAQKGYWNLDHPALDELKQFLEGFR